MPPATNSTLSALDPNESRAWQHTTAIIVCPTIAAVLTALRFYTRLALLKKCFWEDLSIGVALVRKSRGVSAQPRMLTSTH